LAENITLMTYNVHSCVGTDRKLDPGRIAQVIAQAKPDIVALQEVDVGRSRTGGLDQARAIASLLKMQAHFHPALTVAEELYGDAIITALPTGARKAGLLPSMGEPRGAIALEIFVSDQKLLVINTHLGLRGRERIQQMNTLLGAGWIGDHDGPVILCGDFNAIPASAAYRAAARRLRDVQQVNRTGFRPTFPSRFPVMRLDHIFVTEAIGVVDAYVPDDPLARMASDHLPLVSILALSR
jgi:endonuclease/exonuclease/phosphatase family metal-dependent hydrolase